MPDPEPARYFPLFAKTVLAALVAVLLSAALYTGGVRSVYGDRATSTNRRFGESADWYVKPILRTQPHR